MKYGRDEQLEQLALNFLRQNDESYYSKEKYKGLEYSFHTDYNMEKTSRPLIPMSCLSLNQKNKIAGEISIKFISRNGFDTDLS